jgi:flagellin-like protein
MRLRKLLDDDDAVSPVIGVILMVAITVILAAVIASFVLGLGPSGGDQPTASFGFDYTNSTNALKITHEQGDQIKKDNLYLRGDDVGNTGKWDGSASATIGSDSAVSSGDSWNVSDTTSNYTANVVWETDDNSATLSSDDGPDA